MANPSPLAPGFRFHPTDEELVLFYLKRKLLSRPFPVDAIPEVDLYRSEPWELPEKSPIRGGDREWYFFCRLYRNRSRANRATARGYWKTTGKDRAVRSGVGREVGTKKTLVFHVGRAPKGERTNWVMHEYRIMAGEIGLGGIDQDAYVVCRIFQKSGPGPQKGAQYGALVVEEEWEHDDNTMTLREEGASSPPVDPGEEHVAQSAECEQKRLSLKISDENASCSQESDGTQDAVLPADMLGEARDEPVPNNVTFGESSGSVVLSRNAPGTPDDYLEVDDLAASLDGVYPAEGPVSLTYGLCIDMGGQCDYNVDHFSSLADFHGVDEFFDASDDTTIDDEKFLKDSLNIWADEYTCGEQVDEEIYFDAPMLLSTSKHVCLGEESDFVDAMVTGSAPDPMDELVAYFGATEDRLEGPYSEHLEREGPGTVSAVGHSDEGNDNKPSGKSCRSTNDPKKERGASSSTNLQFISDLSTAQDRDELTANDAPYKKCKDNTLEGHLASMLGSISCPPALAAEMSKSLRPGATSQASTSIHVTAGIIHIESYFVDRAGIHMSAPKTRDADILLSYSTQGINGHNNLLTVVEKTGAGSVMLTDFNGISFLLACFSIAFLALIFKVGIYMHSW